MSSIIGSLRRALNAERIEDAHGEVRLHTSSHSLTLSKDPDLETIFKLGDFKNISLETILGVYNTFKALEGIAENITDQSFISYLNLLEDEAAYMRKSNEYLSRSLGIQTLVSRQQNEWSETVPKKTLAQRLSRADNIQLQKLMSLPNREIREASEAELSRRAALKIKSKDSLSHLDKVYSITSKMDAEVKSDIADYEV